MWVHGKSEDLMAYRPNKTLSGNTFLPAGGAIVYNTSAGAIGAIGTNEISVVEYGTYTPAFTAGTPTYSNQIGRYQRINKRVSVFVGMNVTGITSPTGNYAITLPFTTANVSNVAATGTWLAFGTNVASGAGKTPVLLSTSNSSSIVIETYTESTGAAAGLTMGSGAAGFQFNITYETT